MAPLFRRIRARIAGTLGERAQRHEKKAKRAAAVGEQYSHAEEAIGLSDLDSGEQAHEIAAMHSDYASISQKRAKKLRWWQRLIAPKPPKEKK